MSDMQEASANPEEFTELIRLRRQLGIYQAGSVVEIGAINSNVRSYCEHWESRALKAEAALSHPQPPLERTEQERHKMAHTDIPVMGIHLRKEGKYTIVEAEIGGAWIEVIRELSESNFSHIVEPAGMYARYYAMPGVQDDR